MSQLMLKFVAALFLTLTFSLRASGQELDQDCRPITIPAECRQTAAELATLEASYDDRINSLQEQLARASTRAKAAIIRRIRELERQRAQDRNIARLSNELERCKQQFDTIPRRQDSESPLNATFV